MKLDITTNRIIIFIIIGIIEAIIYLFMYSKKGVNKSKIGCFHAITNALSIVFISFFIFMSNIIFIELIKQQSYWGLVLPLAWFFIIYFTLKGILAHDFGLDIHIFNSKSEKKLIINNFLPVIFMCIIGLIVLCVSLYTFFYNLNNELYKTISFGILTIIIIVINLMIFRFLIYCINKYNKSNDTIKELKFNSFYKICILVICFLIGLSLFSLRLEDYYSHKNKEYIKTTGEFFYAQKSSYSKEDFYYLYYCYVANGKRHIVRSETSVGEALIPRIGTQKTVLYNKYNPEDAYIKGDNIFLNIIATCFVCVPLFALILNVTKKKSNKIDS